MNLSTHERSLIKNSWTLLKAEAGISNELVFYESFFRLAPDAQKYFKKKNGGEVDYKKLTRKFSYTMDFIINNINDLEKIPNQIADLGSIHNKLKIEREYYALFTESILVLIDELLGNRSTDELKGAWKKVLEYISERMQAAPIKEKNTLNRLLNKLFGNH